MRLDIVMPYWGDVAQFRQAVESVLAQEDPEWRLLVIDDAYPDLSAGEWYRSLDDPRLEYLRNEKNVGINANFQASVDFARSDWFVIMGCDDVMLSSYVGRIRELAARYPHAALIHPGTEVIDENGRVFRGLVDRAKDFYKPSFAGTLVLGGERLAVTLTRGNWINFPAIAWRRELVARHGFATGLDVVLDLELVLQLLLDGGDVVLDDRVVFRYRRHAASVSSWMAADGSRFAEERAYFAGLEKRFHDAGWYRAERAARRHVSSRLNAVTRIPAALRARDWPSARELVRHAVAR